MSKPEGKFLCYDHSSSKDVSVNLVTYDDGSRAIQLWEEPDKPFQTGFTREWIRESEFEMRQISGKSLVALIKEHERTV